MNQSIKRGAVRLAMAALVLVSFAMGTARAAEPGLDTMIGQMLMIGFRGTDASAPGVQSMLEDIEAGRVGGVALFDYDVILKERGRNITSPEQLKRLVALLQSRAKVPLLVAVDQEGGKVRRLKPRDGFPEALSAQELGSRNDPAFTEAAGETTGRMLAEAGINLNCAPVVDVNVNPDNPVIGKLERSFSASPQTVADMARAFIRGQSRCGVLSCIKHFPGHGSAWNDSHSGMADVTATWTPLELIPYETLFAEKAPVLVMTAHVFNANLDPDYPATLSKKIITGMLRGDLGFQGVVISDDMQMKAVTQYFGLEESIQLAVNAGVDILLFPNNLEYDPAVASTATALIKRMVAEGRIPGERIQESYARIMAIKQSLSMQ